MKIQTATVAFPLTPPDAVRSFPVDGVAVKKTANAKLREAVGTFVGNVFYGTLMQQMQNSKFKGEYFGGSRTEEVFRGQLHQEIARRMGQSPSDPIASRMYKAIERQNSARGVS